MITLREIQDPQQTLPTDSSLPKYLRRVQKVFEETQKFTSCTERRRTAVTHKRKKENAPPGVKEKDADVQGTFGSNQRGPGPRTRGPASIYQEDVNVREV